MKKLNKKIYNAIQQQGKRFLKESVENYIYFKSISCLSGIINTDAKHFRILPENIERMMLIKKPYKLKTFGRIILYTNGDLKFDPFMDETNCFTKFGLKNSDNIKFNTNIKFVCGYFESDNLIIQTKNDFRIYLDFDKKQINQFKIKNFQIFVGNLDADITFFPYSNLVGVYRDLYRNNYKQFRFCTKILSNVTDVYEENNDVFLLYNQNEKINLTKILEQNGRQERLSLKPIPELNIEHTCIYRRPKTHMDYLASLILYCLLFSSFIQYFYDF
jgi:hypothetical protein